MEHLIELPELKYRTGETSQNLRFIGCRYPEGTTPKFSIVIENDTVTTIILPCASCFGQFVTKAIEYAKDKNGR